MTIPDVITRRLSSHFLPKRSGTIDPGPSNFNSGPKYDEGVLANPRHSDFFPPGIERTAQHGEDVILSHSIAILKDKLFDHNHIIHANSIAVTSVSYCKRRGGPEHEFLLFRIVDLKNPPLSNYMILDRTVRDQTRHKIPVPTSGTSDSPFSYVTGTPAVDQLHVSYFGDRSSLLSSYCGSEYDRLEILDFHDETFQLNELIVLASSTSRLRPDYHIYNAQCFWFARMIWENLRIRFPASEHRNLMNTQGTIFGLALTKVESPEDVREAFLEEHHAFLRRIQERQKVVTMLQNLEQSADEGRRQLTFAALEAINLPTRPVQAAEAPRTRDRTWLGIL
ncbi:hypothetical protein BDV93DRAFT_558562 [Ceratobasidium sp. AG-I]|nr:hypothetical protein BDV93DRAFT_558562 [Ceratobasidium sp. AG-I]